MVQIKCEGEVVSGICQAVDEIDSLVLEIWVCEVHTNMFRKKQFQITKWQD